MVTKMPHGWVPGKSSKKPWDFGQPFLLLVSMCTELAMSFDHRRDDKGILLSKESVCCRG